MTAKLCCTFDELRHRAYELADTGQFNHWEEIAFAIEREDCPDAPRRLTADPILMRLLNARCQQAKDRLG